MFFSWPALVFGAIRILFGDFAWPVVGSSIVAFSDMRCVVNCHPPGSDFFGVLTG